MGVFLLVTHGSDGDVLPFVGLGGALVRAGHRAVLLTHAPYRDAAAAAGLGFAAIDDETAFERTLVDTTALAGGAGGGLSWDAFYRRNGMFDQIAAECALLRTLHRPGETVLVGRHTSAVSVRFAAETLGAPAAWVALAPTQLMAVPVAAHTYATELGDGFAEVRLRLGLPPLRDWRRWFAGADAEIGLWPQWFDAAGHRCADRVALTGFPLADGDAEVLGARSATGGADPLAGLFDAGVRPVVATGGTGRMLDPAYYPALVEAVGETGLPTLLVVRHRDLLPDRLPGTVRWSPGLPFAAVLPRAAALVHHGGIGTCARALAAGTPQVLMADGIDRPDNADRLARLGLARTVPVGQWRTGALAARIRAAAADTGYPARARAVTGDPDGRAAADAAADRLTALLADGPRTADRPPADRLRGLTAAEVARLRERLRRRPPAAARPDPGQAPRPQGGDR
ncbi:glycosyltransferase [Streptomyces sp. NPDC092296]|uniref:glycosyltransferase n=1 Tax=Streptomyces sp. NPDC092296 TaxID=3366012 RepID=UPI00380DC2AC